jgi:hypothetical protein
MRYLFIFIIGVVVGCGSSGPFDYEKVSGKITYEDGTPIPGATRLQFIAQDAPAVEGASPRPAVANVNAQGEFDVVTSYKYGDGLIAGKHKVAIESGGDPTKRVPVAKEYLSPSTTPLVVDTAEAPFNIKVPKPAAGSAR